jgi:4-alpha-glucanotransferase
MISPDVLLEKGLLTEKELKEVPSFKTDGIEYGRVLEYKSGLLRLAYNRFKKTVNSGYKKFLAENAFWLDDYALFMACKGYFIDKRKNEGESKEYKAFARSAGKKTAENMIKDCYFGGSWNSFPKGLRDREEDSLKEFKKLLKDEIGYWSFVQYEFYAEWLDIKSYANEQGIEIIGDIPIFVAADSSDTWAQRELFCINAKGFPTEVAGVPPDYFSEEGQLWGNPLYDWRKHKAQGYSWWIKRIENVMTLTDIVRIDHFRAFDSYWSIPYGDKNAINGKWKKGPNRELFDAAESKLGKVNIIAEDLGDLTEGVYKLRDELGFPGMKILEFAFGSDSANEYLPFNYKTTNCVVYTGTHDNDTAIGWYRSTDERTRDRVRRMLNVSGDDIAWDLIRYAISSSADYAIIPVQDVLRLDNGARMNTPGTSSGNWQFRFDYGMLQDRLADDLRYLCELFNR